MKIKNGPRVLFFLIVLQGQFTYGMDAPLPWHERTHSCGDERFQEQTRQRVQQNPELWKIAATVALQHLIICDPRVDWWSKKFLFADQYLSDFYDRWEDFKGVPFDGLKKESRYTKTELEVVDVMNHLFCRECGISIHDRLQATKVLLDVCGADPNMFDFDNSVYHHKGQTALMYALDIDVDFSTQQPLFFELLLNRTPSAAITEPYTRDGRTLLRYAQDQYQDSIQKSKNHVFQPVANFWGRKATQLQSYIALIHKKREDIHQERKNVASVVTQFFPNVLATIIVEYAVPGK